MLKAAGRKTSRKSQILNLQFLTMFCICVLYFTSFQKVFMCFFLCSSFDLNEINLNNQRDSTNFSYENVLFFDITLPHIFFKNPARYHRIHRIVEVYNTS